MSNVIQLPGTAPSQAAISDDASSHAVHERAKHEAFWRTVRERFTCWHIARNVSPAYTEKCLRQMELLMVYAGKGLTELQEADYERWSASLIKGKGHAISTLRTYQKHVRQVLGYVCAAHDLQGISLQTFGVKVQQFAHRHNSVIHVTTTGGAKKKLRPMTHEEVRVFLEAITVRIKEAEAYAPREVRALCRDKALFYLMYIHGPRIGELTNIDVDDWRPVKEAPELEKYGQLRVTGKGARTSGPRTRNILTLVPKLAETMDWYERKVRPLYLPKGSKEQAFFLSEQGKRISAQTIYLRFKQHLEYAGLQEENFSPHTMRRNMVSHGGELTDMTMSQHQAGHTNMSTTALYGQVAPDHLRKKAAKIVASQIDSLTGRPQ